MTKGQSEHILIIDDEENLIQFLKSGLEAVGYTVTSAVTGEDGFFLASTVPFDLIILDSQLPGHNGIEILKTLRKDGLKIPIMILTAKNGVEDKVEGLNLGADDYVLKPFALAELLARVRSLFRRGRIPSQTLQLKCGDLEMDVVTRKVQRDGIQLDLAPREFQLLEYFLRNQRCVITREKLARDIWSLAIDNPIIDNAINVYVARLRKKIHLDRHPKLLTTIRGVGYTFEGKTQ